MLESGSGSSMVGSNGLSGMFNNVGQNDAPTEKKGDSSVVSSAARNLAKTAEDIAKKYNISRQAVTGTTETKPAKEMDIALAKGEKAKNTIESDNRNVYLKF